MQQVLAGNGSFDQADATSPPSNNQGICFTGFWDIQNAHLRPCFLPIAAAIPAVIATLVLLLQVIGLVIRRPRWARPFIEEYTHAFIDDTPALKRRWTGCSLILTGLFTIGCILQLALLVLDWPEPQDLYLSAAWLVGLALLVINRPTTAPFGHLTILFLSAIVQAIVIASDQTHTSTYETAIDVSTLVIALFGLLVILIMPLRDPHLSAKEISQPFTESTSSLRSPEDDLTLWQFMPVSWMTPLIRTGSKRQIQDEDVWQLGFEFQHRRLHDSFRQLKGTVIRRLLKANGIDLVILTLLGILECVAKYATPILLQRLLSSMEDSAAPRRAAMTYAAITLSVRLVAAQSGVFSLWYGRRCYERSRGEMITMLYEKTLDRKIAFQTEEKGKEETADAAPEAVADELAPTDGRKPTAWGAILESMSSLFRRSKKAAPVKEPASMGKILNLMRNDVYEVAQRFWEFQNLITKPLSCVFSIALVVRLLGWPSLLAVAAMVLAQTLNAIMARIMIHYEKRRRAATDKKLQVITQFVEAIRHLRWYGWQGHWLDQIITARQQELHLRIITNIWNIAIGTLNSLALDLSPVIAFFTYTVIAKRSLTVDVAFPAMQLFSMMSGALRDLPNLIIVIVNAMVAVDRIEDFMAEPEKLEMNTEALVGDSMAIENGTFNWPGVATPVLRDINISFPEGLSVICGEVASGKTALLQALLGELDMSQGQLLRPREPIAYCAQTPWLQSMSIRENILFSAAYDDSRYKQVLDACALTPDLAEFQAGDLSLIGENGVGLSGGQRARVALARAVYSNTKILLLDDPLSALDQQTAEAIVCDCLAGPLLKCRTTVLITHRTDLVFGIAKQVIEMTAGHAQTLDHTASDHDHPRQESSDDESEDEQQALQEKIAAAVPDKFIEDEHRAEGGVKARVYWEYVRAGDLRLWVILVVALVMFRLVAYGEAWFLKTWGEAYNEQAQIDAIARMDDVKIQDSLIERIGKLPPPEDNIKPWLVGFLLFAISQPFFYVVSQSVMLCIVYVAARRMFADIMDKVAHATFRFYDVTPVGRLMNRMTSDIGVIDGNISQHFHMVVWLALNWLSSMIVIGSVTPVFIAFSLVLTTAFVLIFLRFLPTSQSLRRLEMISLTPLMSNFGALLAGLTTVRAFGAQGRFQDRVIHVVDTFQKMDHFYWSLQGWLMYRFDCLSAVSTFLLTTLALVTDVSAGLTAFVLLAAEKYVNSTHGLCRQYGQLQMEFVSVERVVELLHIDQEPAGVVQPPAWWPSFSGDIVFDNVTIKYAPHLDPALSGVSFTVKGGSKTAIIGRTGSGKSTLALSILATILPTSGRITIDNVDLATVDKQLLRHRITFLAQDPVLFPGTMRQNLDPINDFSDAACSAILQRLCGRQAGTLDTPVEAGGRNLSQGQRQLVGLARAVLRRSAIIILDEATASIDRDTAMQIQQIMHEEMAESTVITIAHRLEAVRNADYCIVLGKGRVLEQGPAGEMLDLHREDMVDS